MRLLKNSTITFLSVFLVLCIGSAIHIQLGSIKAPVDVKDQAGNWTVAWDVGGPDVIPSNMQEAIGQLTQDLPERDLKRYRELVSRPQGELTEEELLELHDKFGHLSLGMSIRSTWGLWHGSRLARWLGWRVGWHPDNMSAAIMEQFERYLRGESVSSLNGRRLRILIGWTIIVTIPLGLLYLVVQSTQFVWRKWSNKALDPTRVSRPAIGNVPED